MSGGAFEYVMGVMTAENGNPLSGTNANSNSGFVGNFGEGGSIDSGYGWPKEKYYDKYQYETSYSEYTRRILGDATNEAGPFGSVKYGSQIGRQISSWYADYAYFLYPTSPWFARSYTYSDGSGAGVFAFSVCAGSSRLDVSFRVVLTP